MVICPGLDAAAQLVHQAQRQLDAGVRCDQRLFEAVQMVGVHRTGAAKESPTCSRNSVWVMKRPRLSFPRRERGHHLVLFVVCVVFI